MEASLSCFSRFSLCMLLLKQGQPCSDFSLLWGRFPPEHYCNAGQVPLLFIVSQDSACILKDESNSHAAAPSESFQKRKFTMQVFVNAGEKDKRDGFTILVNDSYPNGRRNSIEKMSMNANIAMSFKKMRGLVQSL